MVQTKLVGQKKLSKKLNCENKPEMICRRLDALKIPYRYIPLAVEWNFHVDKKAYKKHLK